MSSALHGRPSRPLGCNEQVEAISLKVSAVVEQANKDKRAALLEEAFESLRQCDIKGRVFQLELALWKSSMINCEVLADAAVSDRLESRVLSGSSVVIPSVIPFLQQTRPNNAHQNSTEEDSDSTVVVDSSPSVSVVSMMEILDNESETQSDSEDDVSVIELYMSSGDSIAALG